MFYDAMSCTAIDRESISRLCKDSNKSDFTIWPTDGSEYIEVYSVLPSNPSFDETLEWLNYGCEPEIVDITKIPLDELVATYKGPNND